MTSSSPPPSSSSSSSTSGTAETQLLPSLSPPLPLPLRSLQSPELQAEFLRERRNKLSSRSDVAGSSVSSSSSSPPFSPPFSPSSPPPSPFSPTPLSSPCSSSSSTPSPRSDSRQARLSLSLSSPELLSELRDSRTKPLRHVPAHNGLTTVFSGRGGGGGGRGGGRRASGPAPSTQAANQKPSH